MRNTLLIACILTMCTSYLFAQKSANDYPVFNKVEKAINKTALNQFSLTTKSTAKLATEGIAESELKDGVLLDLDLSAISSLRSQNPDALTLNFPTPDDQSVKLTLVKNKVLTPDFILRQSSNVGQVMDYTPGLYYIGVIENDPSSLVSISIFEEEIIGMIHTDNGNLVIGKLQNTNNNKHIIYNDNKLSTPLDLDCGTLDDGGTYHDDQLTFNMSEAVGDCVRIYIEIDDDIVSNKGGAVPATNYVTGIMNEVITLYANDNLAMAISEILAWDTPAPYNGGSSSAMLSSYQSNTGNFNGDLSHLVSYQASGGIAAGFAGLCNSNVDNSKCFSSIDATYAVVPTYSFTVMVMTHEMGHLIGSRHTHACVWNGNNTAIDGCAGQTEGSCSLPPSPPSGGTIMSYCHITTGIDFTQGFGPQPQAVILNSVANANCLSACSGPTCTDGVQNGNETGVDCGGPDCAPCNTGCNDNDVNVNITFDNYPEETSWTIKDAGGATVASGGTYPSQPDGSSISLPFCLVDGCYDFTINDTYGDGICCSYGNGSYTVTDGVGTVLASGGAFASSETTNFCFGGGGPILGCTNSSAHNYNPAATQDDGSCETCSDGVQNGDETGTDCGGALCAACVVPGCTDPSAHNYNASANQDDGSCETCSDGVQNGDETGVDCGGALCASCGGGGTTTIFAHYFESGWDGWADGGSDCYRYSGSRSWEGNRSIRIRDNSGTASSMTSSAYNMNGYISADVEFYFYPYSMETGEDFWLQVRNNGGSWVTVASYASGSSFNNNTFYVSTVNVTNLSSSTQFRFRCDASANGDQIYIDAVTLTGNSAAGLIENRVTIKEVESPIRELAGLESADLESQEVSIYPNPAGDYLNIKATNIISQIKVYSASGELVKVVQSSDTSDEIDIAELSTGFYYISIETTEGVTNKKFVKL